VSPRDALHQQIDALPEEDLPIAERLLAGLRATADPVARALVMAPVDDEPDDDDFDGGLTEAREEAARGEWISHEDLKRELGLE
jgi:hypothetical protein